MWTRFVIILSVAALIGAGNILLNSNRPPWAADALLEGEIELADVPVARPAVLWLDARSQEDYAKGHIPEALLLNEDDWDHLLPEVLSAWRPGQWIVVYCSSQKCQASQGVAKRLRSEVGMRDVHVLKGGWETWQAR
jgi:rhodanese-related sulfurtransferase